MSSMSVTQLNMLIQREIAMSVSLKNLEVSAEISQLTKHRSGHWYFTIKDALSTIDCVMFKSQVDKLKTKDFNQGDQVKLQGQINLYEKTARLQFYVKNIEPAGSGRLFKQYLYLKEALTREGLFDVNKKQSLPPYPKKVALLSAEGGAATKDFITIFHRRNPFCEIKFYPISVQGKQVSADVLLALDKLTDEDLVVITRGGGSFEDLFCFNDEQLVRRVAKEHRPVISAIGHEVDVTLIELASDRRGATPTEAAELATRNVAEDFKQLSSYFSQYGSGLERLIKHRGQELLYHYDYFKFKLEKNQEGALRTVDDLYAAMSVGLERKVRYSKERSENLRHSLALSAQRLQGRLHSFQEELKLLTHHKISQARERLKLDGEFLAGANPLSTLHKGYVYVEKQGHKLTTVAELKPGDVVHARAVDGHFNATINEVESHEF